MKEPVKKQLMDDAFMFKQGDRFLSIVNMNKDWPAGRAIFHNKNKTLLIWVNEEDHIRIFSMQRGHDIKEVF